jgi:hypothetical protein
MKKALHSFLLVLVLVPLAFSQSENSPFFGLEKQVKQQRGWMMSKETLSAKFNAERIGLRGVSRLNFSKSAARRNCRKPPSRPLVRHAFR